MKDSTLVWKKLEKYDDSKDRFQALSIVVVWTVASSFHKPFIFLLDEVGSKNAAFIDIIAFFSLLVHFTKGDIAPIAQHRN